MQTLLIVLGIIAAAIIGVLFDWVIKYFLPEKPNARHFIAVIIFLVILIFITTFSTKYQISSNTIPTSTSQVFSEETNISSPVPFPIETSTQIIQITPTFILPVRSIGHRQIPDEGSAELVLDNNQVAIGTADEFQDVMQFEKPPFTIFVIYGPINIQLSMVWGGWDQWENASEDFIEEQIRKKIQEVISSHPTDYDTRGYRVIKCYGQVENCETILTFP